MPNPRFPKQIDDIRDKMTAMMNFDVQLEAHCVPVLHYQLGPSDRGEIQNVNGLTAVQ